MTNPFIISGYRSPQHFCDRENETARVISAIRNMRHLTLFSLRRMGKTGLIRHVFNEIENEKRIIPVYTDIMATTNIAEFTTGFARAIFSTLAKKPGRLKTILTSMASLRPALTYDPVTGMPEITIKPGTAAESEHSLDTVFKYLSQQDQHIVCAIDEFQQIAAYPEKNIEAILRTHIQAVQNVTFIFSGSRKRILSDIFSNPARPFFNSTEIMELDNIKGSVYKEFIRHHFNEGKMSITDEALDRIEAYTSMHTFYVQFLCNRLFGAGYKSIGTTEAEEAYRQILRENEPVYASYINLVTHFQFRLLRALAKENGASAITSKEFIEKYGLGAASSVNTAVKSLTEKDFIYMKDKRYFLVDRFFKGWMEQKLSG